MPRGLGFMECCCLAHSLFVVAERLADRIAAIYAGIPGVDEVACTFSQLWSSVERISERLSSLSGDHLQEISLAENNPRRIGVLVHHSVEYLAAIVAVTKVQAAFVPLDPFWPRERIIEVAKDAAVCAIICCDRPEPVQQLAEICQLVGCSHICVEDCSRSPVEHEKKTWLCKELPFSYIMYTSGSTGKPKGVCGTQAGLMNRLKWMQDAYPFLPSDVACFKTSISFIDHLTESLGPLLAGVPLVVPCARSLKQNVLQLVTFLEVYKISRLVAVPSLLRAMMPALQSSSTLLLRVVVSSGETLHRDLVMQLQRLLPKTKIINLYGSTEVSGDCMYFDCDDLRDGNTVPIGRPIAGCSAIILSDRGNVPVGDVGELYISGAGLAHGYWMDATATSRSFVNRPEHRGRLFRTGDLAKWRSGGEAILVGRKDRLLKVRGQRIEPEEVEACLQEHPKVRRAAVCAVPCSQADVQLIAFVVPEEECEGLEDILKQWIRARRPAYMVPEFVHVLIDMPLTESGKLDYSALVNLHACRTVTDSSHIEVSETMKNILKVFSEVLLMDNVTARDDFFLLGGTSITAAHAAHKLGIDMRLIFRHRSAIELEKALHEFDDHQVEDTGLKVPAVHRRSSVCNCRMGKRRKVEAGERRYLSKWPHGLECRGFSFVRGKWTFKFDDVSTSIYRFSSSSWSINTVWEQCLHACVDSSPLLVANGSCYRIYVGSHAHVFACLDAISGKVQWETTLGDRIESTAAITQDFSQVVVGCYDGNIYFLDAQTGTISWAYRTGGEVKCQPIVDSWQGLVWCGSHDHHLYVLDPVARACVSKHDCGGSIFASPVMNLATKQVCVATTNSQLIVFKTQPEFRVCWEHALPAPVFGSPAFDPGTCVVIVAAVDGSVTAFSSSGSVAWKARTDGPIFAGVCTSSAISGQALVCSRDGHVYCYNPANGDLFWRFNVGEPLVAGPAVEELVELYNADDVESARYRLFCVCGTSGTVSMLRAPVTPLQDPYEVVRTKLPGEVFSTPLFVRGRIFVACRDDNVYCLEWAQMSTNEEKIRPGLGTTYTVNATVSSDVTKTK